MKNLGMFGIMTSHGAYLQAHKDSGEMHGSNSRRNEEETWFLFVDEGNSRFALMNWSNGRFMHREAGKRCCGANAVMIDDSALWQIVSGIPHGIQNGVAFRSYQDGNYLVSNRPGDGNDDCGGEVVAAYANSPIPNNSPNWDGWFRLETATTPSPGHNLWNTVGGAITNLGNMIVNNISPGDIAAAAAYFV